MSQTTTELTIINNQAPAIALNISTDTGLNHAYRVAKALALSGFFKDSKTAQQAMAKIIAGVEYGIGAYAAMTQIHVIEGKLSPGATLVAALIQRSGRYRFRQVKSDATICVLEFFFRDDDGSWVSSGEVSFTIEEAKIAGLAGKNNWKGYPADMLFARALGRGARRFCAEVFGGASTYTPDELGAETNAQGNLVEEVLDEDAVEAIIAEVDAHSDEADAPELAEFEEVTVTVDDDPLGGMDSPRIQIPVTGRKGDQYTITVFNDGSWNCSCPAYTPDCHHVTDIRRPYPGGVGYLWPGDADYDNAPPADASVPETPADAIPLQAPETGLLAYAKQLGIRDTDAMMEILKVPGGPEDMPACIAALDGLAASRRAAAEEAGEAA